MDDLTNSFIRSFFPQGEMLFPYFEMDENGWIIGSAGQGRNLDFNTQLVKCLYSPSGSYGPTSRFIFYFLIIIAVVWRRVGWVANVALGTVMVYSSTTAIHAIILASIRTQLVPEAVLKNYEVVRVEATSTSGEMFQDPWTQATIDNSLWIPVLPMAWDVDPDPVLSIVGLAFLVLLPMQIWSLTLRKSNLNLILWLWGLLLFAGSICALVAEAYYQLWAFPQVRFCPPGFNDTLPLMNDGSQTIGGIWDGVDRYHWNRTVLAQFVDKTSTQPLSNLCIYPCFDTTWPLRDNMEIQVIPFVYGPDTPDNLFYSALVAVFFLFGATSVASLSSAVIMSKPGRRFFAAMRLDYFSEIYDACVVDGKDLGTTRFPWYETLIIFRFIYRRYRTKCPGSNAVRRTFVLFLQGYFLSIFVYTWLFSLPVCLFFLIFMEYNIWAYDPPGEKFNHVGQWGTMVSLLLAFGAAVLGKVIEMWRKYKLTRKDSTSRRLSSSLE